MYHCFDHDHDQATKSRKAVARVEAPIHMSTSRPRKHVAVHVYQQRLAKERPFHGNYCVMREQYALQAGRPEGEVVCILEQSGFKKEGVDYDWVASGNWRYNSRFAQSSRSTLCGASVQRRLREAAILRSDDPKQNLSLRSLCDN